MVQLTVINDDGTGDTNLVSTEGNRGDEKISDNLPENTNLSVRRILKEIVKEGTCVVAGSSNLPACYYLGMETSPALAGAYMLSVTYLNYHLYKIFLLGLSGNTAKNNSNHQTVTCKCYIFISQTGSFVVGFAATLPMAALGLVGDNIDWYNYLLSSFTLITFTIQSTFSIQLMVKSILRLFNIQAQADKENLQQEINRFLKSYKETSLDNNKVNQIEGILDDLSRNNWIKHTSVIAGLFGSSCMSLSLIGFLPLVIQQFTRGFGVDALSLSETPAIACASLTLTPLAFLTSYFSYKNHQKMTRNLLTSLSHYFFDSSNNSAVEEALNQYKADSHWFKYYFEQGVKYFNKIIPFFAAAPVMFLFQLFRSDFAEFWPYVESPSAEVLFYLISIWGIYGFLREGVEQYNVQKDAALIDKYGTDADKIIMELDHLVFMTGENLSGDKKNQVIDLLKNAITKKIEIETCQERIHEVIVPTSSNPSPFFKPDSGTDREDSDSFGSISQTNSDGDAPLDSVVAVDVDNSTSGKRRGCFDMCLVM